MVSRVILVLGSVVLFAAFDGQGGDMGRMRERLSRGLTVVSDSMGRHFLSWRLYADDPEGVSFDVYQKEGESRAVRLNESPIVESTTWSNWSSKSGLEETRRGRIGYFVVALLEGKQLDRSKMVEVCLNPYLEIPIVAIPGYRAGDASVGDLDGDGDYEIVLHQVSKGRDNSFAGVTGQPILDAYEFSGAHLWRIDLGRNIREGEHYTQFMVYDLDGDGSAEVVCKTADGTLDGLGKAIGDGGQDWRFIEEGDPRHGRILDGPEYLTVFSGKTGEALQTVDYVPGRDPIDGWGGIGGNGGNDSYGNRCDRFLACVAYLDGLHPSVVTCRGVYGRTVVCAWDWRGGQLSRRWLFDSGISYPPFKGVSPYSGMGGHSLSVGDIDLDGRDEIIYQAMTIDDDGKGLYSTQRRHGDSMHLADMDPERPGQELFLITENEQRTVQFMTPGAGLHDARTGTVIWSHSPGVDVTFGLAADIDPRHLGYEIWGGPGGLRTVRGEEIGPQPATRNWVIWWDGDRLRELYSRQRILKWNWKTGEEEVLLTLEAANRQRNPNLVGDLVGDWREEILVTSPDGGSLRLYVSTEPTRVRMPTLMHDFQYRLGIAWQNVVYNKPAHPSFYLGESRLR